MNIIHRLKVLVMCLMLSVISAATYTYGQAAPVLSFTSYTRLSPNTKTGLGASTAYLNGTIYLAMKGDGNDYLWLSKSTNGTNVTSTEYGTVINYAPSIAVFNNKLYVAYTTQSGSIYEISTTDGSIFTAPVLVYSPSSLAATSGPTLVVYNGSLYAYWEEDYTNVVPQNQIEGAVMSVDGTFWSATGLCFYSGSTSTNSPTSHSAVGAAVFNSQLFLGIQLGNSTTANTLLVCRSGGFTSYSLIHPEGGISAAVYNGSLYFAYKGNTSANYLELTGTSDGSTFTTPGTQVTSPPIRINGTSGYEIAPSLLNYNSKLWVFYTANDNTHYLYQTHSTN